jgi:ABC-type bacteriocin/lantibiotic exporter with double-glycine peptidase domain
MDCGPAALAALLNGCGIDVSYPRLREACQTDVDGTSIDTLEELALRFGLDAEQLMLPCDFLLDPRNHNLPCLAVVTLPNGLTHFIVIWRALLGWFEVMDPARGRCWMRSRELDAMLYRHELQVPAQDWFEYTRSDAFVGALRGGLQQLAIRGAAADALLARVHAAADWREVRLLDAALRMCRSLDRRGTRLRGNDAAALINHALGHPELIPAQYFQVASGDADGQVLQLRGAVVLKVAGVRDEVAAAEPVISKTLGGFHVAVVPRLWALLREIGFAHLALQLPAIAVVMGVLTLIEALVFRYLLGFQAPTELSSYTLVLLVVLLPSAAALACNIGQTRFSQVLGRQLETRLRTDLLRKLPRIRDDYFASRLVSDLAERGHAITQLRDAPLITTALLVDFVRIAMVLSGLAWVMTSMLWVVALAGVFAIAAPLLMFGALAERDLRARSHLGALSNLYLDALRGTEPIWTHGAARSLELEHETLLLRWVRASARLRRTATAFETVQVFALAACGIALVLGAHHRALPQGTVLLVAYWALFVPMLSRGLLVNLKQLPAMHNIVRRVLEVLDAPEEASEVPTPRDCARGGVQLELRQVSVVRGAQRVLAELDVTIGAGERVAIVGESGSGKSSFLGALSGWHTISDGRLLIDGTDADATLLQALRQRSALVDPETYLWNRELYANVVYGVPADAAPAIDMALDASELVFDLEKMGDGLATQVGENGSRLSGGESQRLRIARALIRSNARLVLLDEPFAGMDADQRERMRRSALERWPDATLLWVSHHVRETATFPRVLVFERGRIVEDGAPAVLLNQASRYAAMVAAEDDLNARLRRTPWRSITFGDTSATGRA